MAFNLDHGFFILPRGWMKNPHFKSRPFSDHLAYAWSLEEASFFPHEQQFNGIPYWVERGEFVTSLDKMAEVFGWSIHRVRGLVDRMIKAGIWAKRGAYRGATAPTVIIICNYEEIQSISSYVLSSEGKASGRAGAKRGQSDGREHKEWNKKREMKGNEGSGASEDLTDEEAALIGQWNANAPACGWPEVGPLSEDRRHKFRNSLAQEGGQRWENAIRKASYSKWLSGPERPSWFRFDALFDPDKFQNILSGKYD